jgi:hypothetical protein
VAGVHNKIQEALVAQSPNEMQGENILLYVGPAFNDGKPKRQLGGWRRKTHSCNDAQVIDSFDSHLSRRHFAGGRLTATLQDARYATLIEGATEGMEIKSPPGFLPMAFIP